MPIKNYTSIVPVEKTLGEIQQALRKAGASAVMVTYDGNQNIEAVSFKLRVAGDRHVSFRLPGRVDGVLLTMQRQKVEPRFCNRTQAEKVAWRIVKDWITAQLAIVEAEIAEMAEVFLPYADAGNDQTLYERFKTDPNSLLCLPPPRN